MHQGDFPGHTRRGTAASAHDILLQDLDRHIQSPALRRVYQHWRAALLRRSTPPSVESFRFGEDLREHVFVATVRDNSLRFVSAGAVLTACCRHMSVIDDVVEKVFGSPQASYRACIEKEAPVYDYVRDTFGEKPVLCERLILPFFGRGSRVTHLAGVLLLTELGPLH